MQVPFAPVTSHAEQVPAQAVLQHTPSTQWADTHSPFCVHAAPSASSPNRKVEPPLEPPATRARPLGSRVTVGSSRVAPSPVTTRQAAALGSNTSAVDELKLPPTART